jgi:hypothetical protein
MVLAKVGASVMGEVVLTLAIVVVDTISDLFAKGVQEFISNTFCKRKKEEN